MEILKVATDWARAEAFASSFFVVFGIMFLFGSFGFWQLGKTDMARAYVIPLLVAGILLLIIGGGLVFDNMMRVSNFAGEYGKDSSDFVESEINRAEKTLSSSKLIVFKIIPLIIIGCSLVILFVDVLAWRASMNVVIAFMAVLLLIDSGAIARLGDYLGKLLLVGK